MSDRYEVPAQTAIWSREATHRRWRAVELEVMDDNPEVPRGAFMAARLYPDPPENDVARAEEQVGHDLMAWLMAWAAPMKPSTSRWVHHGLTSSDVVDTALSRALVDSTVAILDATDFRSNDMSTRVDGLVETIRTRALEERDTVRAGRTHGQVAAPTTVGLQLAQLGLGVKRAVRRVRSAMNEVNVAKISGPVGAYSEIHPSVEDAVAAHRGGCTPAYGATQVWPRDGIAAWGHALSSLTTACEQIAMWVRLGSQSGIDELAEGRGANQVGSSSMPHKRNPVRSERICGLARVVRSYAASLDDNVVLWNERDISHSSVEREVLPAIANLTHFVVNETRGLIADLEIDYRNIRITLGDHYDELVSHHDLIFAVRSGADYLDEHNLRRTYPTTGAPQSDWAPLVGDTNHVYAALEGD